ncbi:MAG: GTP-dependent dephospho-CoA kinase family protein [Methanocalculaceae archaeon]|jgi:uncharacterized protein (UPF0218 family)|nr:GTP-dependent dephospho-CoA kinase family protein [Methanocalculaceae archaeon]
MFVLLPEHRGLLKRPIGTLFPDFSDIISAFSDRMICTVGDVVTNSALSRGIIPAVGVIDGQTMRIPQLSMPKIPPPILRVKNPAGIITDELVATLAKAVEAKPCVIVVDGEEDLAVLPLIRLVPDGALVIYGQPNEGVVVCEVTQELRLCAERLLSCFAQI